MVLNKLKKTFVKATVHEPGLDEYEVRSVGLLLLQEGLLDAGGGREEGDRSEVVWGRWSWQGELGGGSRHSGRGGTGELNLACVAAVAPYEPREQGAQRGRHWECE